jgi:hypothetical protein
MKAKIGQAVKMFFGNSSLEMVYLEAIANALDANATHIDIYIQADGYNHPKTLTISIKDNGEGFTDIRFNKFCNLFDVDDVAHKGLGRLVYLCYFETITIDSFYENRYLRTFKFTDRFDSSSVIKDVGEHKSGTTLAMSGYFLTKIKRYEYIQPQYLKKRILEEFYSRLYRLKQTGQEEISISITSKVNDVETVEIVSTNDMPTLTKVEIDANIGLFDKMYLHYYIKEVKDINDSHIITAISVDDRNRKLDIIAKENTPVGYEMVFLLYSDYFTGKVDAARQVLTISETDLGKIKQTFRKTIINILNSKAPKSLEQSKKVRKSLVNQFPHLSGYFQDDTIGFSSRNDVLKEAQEKFFQAQREILGAKDDLTDRQYKESLDLSARALTEYILFRQINIEKLKKIDKRDAEASIHNIILPMKQQYDKKDWEHDLYRNNAWILDDKFMTYQTILSDKEMSNVIQCITKGEVDEKNDDRPDICLIFSSDPNGANMVDVVIVELKKKGLTIEENMKTVTQLEKRARNLMRFYKNKIQRIWFYGIIEFNDEVELQLTGEYTELYSTGKMYYRETKIAIQKNPDIIVPIGVFIMDLESVINDADARNSTFLQIIKSKFIH